MNAFSKNIWCQSGTYICTTDRKIIEQSSQKTNDHAIFDPIGNPVWLWNIHYGQFTYGVSYFRWSKVVRFLAYTIAAHLRAAIIRWVKSCNLLSNSLWEKCKFGFKSLKVHSYGKSMYSKYSIVKDSSADLGVNFKIVQNRPTHSVLQRN